MPEHHPKADERRREAIDQIVDRFASTRLGDIIRDQLYYGDDPIIRIADAMESAYSLAEGDILEAEEGDSECFAAAEHLRHALDQEAQAQVLSGLEELLDEDPDVVFEHDDDQTTDLAIEEAQIWTEADTVPGADDSVECDDCGRWVPESFVKDDLVNAVDPDADPTICKACWGAGVMI